MKTHPIRLLPAALLAASAIALAAEPVTSPELEKAHADLKAAWQQTQAAQENLAKIESRLGIDSPRAVAWEFMNNPKRGALGLVFARGRGDATLRVQAVSPGSAAEAAGLREGDTLLAIDKVSFAGLSADDALAELHKTTRTLEVGNRVVVLYSRDGKATTATLVASRPPMFTRRPFDRDGNGRPDGPPHDLLIGGPMAGLHDGLGPVPGGRPSPTGPMPDDVPLQLAALNPGLATYFKVDGGVLVLGVNDRDTDLPTFGLKAGDVVQQIEGQRVETPVQLFDRLMRASGTSVKLALVRAGTPLTITVAVPTLDKIEAGLSRHRRRPPMAIE